MNDRFTDVWERRKNIQLNVMKYWIDDDWTKGRSQYLTFHVRIRDEELIENIVEIQSRLSADACVAPFPQDYSHISVAGLGFLAKSEQYEDDILIENLQRIVNQAKEVLQTFSARACVLTSVGKFLRIQQDDSEDIDVEKCSRSVLPSLRIAKTCIIV